MPSGQNCQKTVRRSAFFVNSALKIQCNIVKNTLLQTAFSAILQFRHPIKTSRIGDVSRTKSLMEISKVTILVGYKSFYNSWFY